MIAIELKIGDAAWIHGLGSKPGLSKGKVVYVANIPGYALPQYIIAFETGIVDVLEVRDPFTVSDDPKRPIGGFRRTAEQVARLKDGAL